MHLLNARANPNNQTVGQSTPLHYASIASQNKVVTQLLDANATNIQNIEGETALHHAAYYGDTTQLLGAKADPNTQNNEGGTPSRGKQAKALKQLLLHSANPTLRNKEGQTPIDVATEEVHYVFASQARVKRA